MSKLDDKYIESLQSFTGALEEIVEMLKDQQKKDQVDPVNEMLKNVPSELQLIVTNLKEVNKRTKEIKQDTSNILTEIKEIRKAKESGMFGQIGGNKKKIVDGVSTIVLIAGGVLAIGLAFKIVGKVDFLSVMALSAAMVAVSYAVQKISDIKGLNWRVAASVSLTMMFISAGLLLSGLILSNFPQIGIMQGLSMIFVAASLIAVSYAVKKIHDIKGLNWRVASSVALTMVFVSAGLFLSGLILSKFPRIGLLQGLSMIFVAAALGVSIWLMMKAIDKINFKKNWSSILLLPTVLPLISIGLTISSKILQDIQPISFKQALSIVLVGVALGVAAFGIGLAFRAIKNITPKQMLTLPITIPLIAGGIVAASIIFQYFVPLKDPLGVLIGSAVMGVGIAMFTPALWAINKIGFKNIFYGSIGLPLIALSIVAVAQIFQLLPDKMMYPSLSWSLGVGLGTLLFLPTMLVVGAVGMTGVGIGILATGLIGLPLIALSMVAVSQILQLGKFDSGYPKPDWALGVGGSLLAFSAGSVLAIPAVVAMMAMKFLTGSDPLETIAQSMVSVSHVLQKGNWKAGGYPSYDWSLGVGTALFMFAGAYAVITAIQGFNSVLSFVTGDKSQSFNQFVVSAAQTMITARALLNVGDWKSAKYPTKDYAEGVGGFLFELAKSYAIITAIQGVNKVLSFLTGSKSQDFDQFVASASNTMLVARSILNNGDWDGAKYPKKEYSEGIGSFLVSMAQAYKTFNSMGFFDLIGALVGTKKVSLEQFSKDASNAIVQSSLILSLGKFTTVPTKAYVDSYVNFISQMAKLVDDVDFDVSKVNSFVVSMRLLLPTLTSLGSMQPISQLAIVNFQSFIFQLNKLPDKSKEIMKLAASFRELSDSLRDIKSFDNLSKISSGLMILSVIDDAKLQVVLDKIKANEDTLKKIYGSDSDLLSKITSIFYSKPSGGEASAVAVSPKEVKSVGTKKDQDDDQKRNKFYNDISAIKGMLSQMMDDMNGPSNNDNFRK